MPNNAPPPINVDTRDSEILHRQLRDHCICRHADNEKDPVIAAFLRLDALLCSNGQLPYAWRCAREMHERRRDNLLTQVMDERLRQDEQWGGPAHDDTLTPADWAVIMVKHVSKIAGLAPAVAYEGRTGMRALKRVFRAIAALGVAAMEWADRRLKPGRPLVPFVHSTNAQTDDSIKFPQSLTADCLTSVWCRAFERVCSRCRGTGWVKVPGSEAEQPCPSCVLAAQRALVLHGVFQASTICRAQGGNASAPTCANAIDALFGLAPVDAVPLGPDLEGWVECTLSDMRAEFHDCTDKECIERGGDPVKDIETAYVTKEDDKLQVGFADDDASIPLGVIAECLRRCGYLVIAPKAGEQP